MQISLAESRILKKVIRAWIESEYGDLAKLNYLKQNIDDCAWKFAKRLNSEIGRAVSLDFIFTTITETILILYPEYDAEERKLREVLKAEEQRKQRELDSIRQREEEEERCKQEDILSGDINRIREIVRNCVCDFFEEEPGEGIDDEVFFNCFYINEFSHELNDAHELIELNMAIEAALEVAVKTKIEFPNELLAGSTINEITKSYSFYLKYQRYPKKSHLHGYVIAISQLICQLKIDAKTFKETLKSMKIGKNWGDGIPISVDRSSLSNKQEANSVLVGFFMRHAPPWSGSMRTKNIEKLISATQVLIDSPNYSSDYGYDEIESDKA